MASHLSHSKNWVVCLGDGTEKSNKKMQKAIDKFWVFTDEMFVIDNNDYILQNAGYIPNKEQLKRQWDAVIDDTFGKAMLRRPKKVNQLSGGTLGLHNEDFGKLIAEMQYLSRCYPQANW